MKNVFTNILKHFFKEIRDKVKKNYGLTNTEMEIMNIFWESGKRFAFKELLEYSNKILGKEWKKQTLSTYLTNLQKMNLLDVDASGKNYIYFALCSKDEYIHQWTKKLVKTTFDNSICKLVVAFTGGKKLSKEEAEELRKLIE